MNNRYVNLFVGFSMGTIFTYNMNQLYYCIIIRHIHEPVLLEL
jgi:uncharacterized protein YcsI (UPF0317 family)